MKYSILIATALSAIAGSSAHAEALLLLDSNPGYVSNHYVFDDFCTLSAQGILTFTSQKTKVSAESKPEIIKTFTKTIVAEELAKIKADINKARAEHMNNVAHYETYSGDAPDFEFEAYAAETEAESDSTPNPLAFAMHGDGNSVLKSSGAAKELLLTMTSECEMDHDILSKLLDEDAKRVRAK